MPVTCFAKLVETRLWTVLVNHYAPYTWSLHIPSKKESHVQNYKIDRALLSNLYSVLPAYNHVSGPILICQVFLRFWTISLNPLFDNFYPFSEINFDNKRAELPWAYIHIFQKIFDHCRLLTIRKYAGLEWNHLLFSQSEIFQWVPQIS